MARKWTEQQRRKFRKTMAARAKVHRKQSRVLNGAVKTIMVMERGRLVPYRLRTKTVQFYERVR